MIEVHKITAGPFMTNTYVLKQNNQVIIIDASGKIEKIKEIIADGNVLALLLTHGHFDHIKIADELKKQYNIPIYLHPFDFELATNRVLNSYGDISEVVHSEMKELNEGCIQIGNFIFEVIHAPGHTEGCVMLQIEDKLFSGDVLFKQSIGRTDLFSGNERKMKQSLRMFRDMNPDLKIYPGHGEDTTIADELINNPFLKYLV